MIRENKWKIILSSIAVMLPALFGLIIWNRLPEMMTTHWGGDGLADGFSSKAFAVIGLPAICLCLHLFCTFFTLADKRQRGQNKKALGMIFWITPLISVFINGMMYASVFGRLEPERFTLILLGLMFVLLGNYLPKIKQNYTLGIKLPWTFYNEENWNKTHRLSGKLWFAGGIIILFSVFLPEKLMLVVMLITILVLTVVPIAYSYYIYRMHRRAGIVYFVKPRRTSEKISLIITIATITAVVVAVTVLFTTGNIEVSYDDDSFYIEADYWRDASVGYNEIESVEYRDTFDAGSRTNGFGSPRLSMGTFRNDEFGSYTLYAYGGSEGFVVMDVDGRMLVIGCKEREEAKEIYSMIMEKMHKSL